MDPEDVTLVIPCYNVADTLPVVLRAVDRLDPSPASIRCIDDGSTDETGAIVDAHPTATLIEHDENRGIATTLNTALANTQTSWLAKIDADIVVPSDWLGTIMEAATEHAVELVQGRFVEQVSTSADRWRATYPSPHFPADERWNKPLNGANILARTDALRDVGGWDERYRRAFDDIDLMERLIDAGYEVYYTPSVESTHIRTDTWNEALRTAWAYHDHPNYAGPLDSPSDLLHRVPYHFYFSGCGIFRDIKRRDVELLPISLARFVYHVKWDLDHLVRDDTS